MQDFTLTNPRINSFFKGESDDAPVDEFLYLHTHPLVRPNFITQVEESINTLTAMMEDGLVPAAVGERIYPHVVILGSALPELKKDSVKEVLFSLREINRICQTFIGKQLRR